MLPATATLCIIPAQTKELVESLKLDVDKIKQQSEKSSVQLQKEFAMIKIVQSGGAGTAWDDGAGFKSLRFSFHMET